MWISIGRPIEWMSDWAVYILVESAIEIHLE